MLYEAGLRHDLDRKKRSLIRCHICTDCWTSLAKEKVPKFSVANKVWIGDVPKELQGLTIPEQRLIALYRHNSCIVKLHSSFHSAATAQSAIKGNCISFPQDVVNIATSLPLQLEDLCDSLKIIFVGCRIPDRNQLKYVLTVRKSKVSNALLSGSNKTVHFIELCLLISQQSTHCFMMTYLSACGKQYRSLLMWKLVSMKELAMYRIHY